MPEAETKSKPEAQPDADPFFDLRRRSESFPIDTSGLWSYPALLAGESGSVYRLILVLRTSFLAKEKKTALFRPKSMLITDDSCQQILQFQDFRIGEDPFKGFDWKKPIGMFPHTGLGESTSYADYEKQEQSLLALYPSISDEFAKSKVLSGEFRKAFIALIHPCFLPFLNVLAPDFTRAVAAGATAAPASE